MRWIGSRWDRAPRVYKEGASRMDKSSAVFESWDECKKHLLTLHGEEVRQAQLALQKAQDKLARTMSAERPE